jgi:hypothetical protein
MHPRPDPDTRNSRATAFGWHAAARCAEIQRLAQLPVFPYLTNRL